jgi:hypothetical protein
LVNHTVKICDLPEDITEVELKESLNSMFPGKILNCEILLDVSEGLKLQEKLKKCIENLNHYKYIEYLEDDRPNQFLITKCYNVDALDYYENQFEDLSEKVKIWDAEYQKALKGEKSDVKSTNTAFVIFEDVVDAQKFLDTYSKDIVKIISRTIVKKKELESLKKQETFQLKVTNALDYDDINWFNYLTRKNYDILREIAGHIFMLFLCIFFTTSSSMLATVESILKLPFIAYAISFVRPFIGQRGDIVFQYLPTLFFQILSSLLSTVVWKVTQFSKYKTKSKYSRTVLFRLYVYMILGVFLVPTLLLTSMDGILKYFQTEKDIIEMFQMLYVPSSGSFFINLMIQMAFLSNFQDLIMIMTLLQYLVYWAISKTPKQAYEAANILAVGYSSEAAFILIITCITLCYSLFSPLILPCALLYMTMKYFFGRLMMGLVLGSKVNPKEIDSHPVVIFRKSWLIVKLMMWNLIGFVLFHFVFFLFKIAADPLYISHAILELILLILIIVIYAILYYFKEIIMKRVLKLDNSILKVKTSYLPVIDFESIKK